jgi:hypothetical protein
MLLTISGGSGYDTQKDAYKNGVPQTFGVGDVIRKARKLRKWNQHRLGVEAKKFTITGNQPKINKTTVSKVEREPFSSEFGTVWRLIAAVGLTLADVEERVGSPFLEEWIAGAGPRAHRRRAPTIHGAERKQG